MTSVFVSAVVLLLIAMCGMFVVGLKAGDNSLIDIAYGPAFVLACWGAWIIGAGMSLHFRILVLLVAIALWGLRLGFHIGLRHRGKGEDFRYRKFRKEWGETVVWRSFLQIYLLQGAVVLVVAAPVLLVIAAPGGGWQWTDVLGGFLLLFGFSFEAIGDWQLLRFKRNPANKGKIIQEGLWRYTRHPNYFGEATLWWGIFLVGIGSPLGFYGLVSPLTIGFLLLKVSGIPMLEKKYQGNPQFETYKARTNAFFPWFPRQRPATASESSKDQER